MRHTTEERLPRERWCCGARFRLTLQVSYHEDLWMEREIKSVANITQHDIREFLPLAANIPITPTVETYRLEGANRAPIELKRGQIRGAKVLLIG